MLEIMVEWLARLAAMARDAGSAAFLPLLQRADARQVSPDAAAEMRKLNLQRRQLVEGAAVDDPHRRHHQREFIGGISRAFEEDDLTAEILYEDRPYILAGKGSKWARRIDLAELANEPWALPRDSIFNAGLAEAFRANGLAIPQRGVRSYSGYQRLTLTATNRFISAESGSVLRFNADRFALKVLPVDLAVRPFPIAVVTLKKRTISSVVQSFIRCAGEVAKPLRRAR